MVVPFSAETCELSISCFFKKDAENNRCSWWAVTQSRRVSRVWATSNDGVEAPIGGWDRSCRLLGRGFVLELQWRAITTKHNRPSMVTHCGDDGRSFVWRYPIWYMLVSINIQHMSLIVMLSSAASSSSSMRLDGLRIIYKPGIPTRANQSWKTPAHQKCSSIIAPTNTLGMVYQEPTMSFGSFWILLGLTNWLLLGFF